MGRFPVTWLQVSAVLLTGYLLVFASAYFNWPRAFLGTQIDFLPALIVCCGARCGLVTLSCAAVVFGLWFDSFSTNRLGISILPLFVVGLATYRHRELILRQEAYAQLILGVAASAIVPALTMLLLTGSGQKPLLGFGSLWHWGVMAIGGGLATPVLFRLFDAFLLHFSYQPMPESSFRPDREIKRGRH